MKKITILFIAAVMSMAAGCSGDDSVERTTEEMFDRSVLFGKWNLETWTINGQSQEISECADQYGFWQFFDTDDVNESFGEIISNECTQQLYSHKYNVAGDVFSVRELNQTIPFQAKYKILDISETRMKIRLFWVSQETPSGGVEEKTIPDNEQSTFTYIKR